MTKLNKALMLALVVQALLVAGMRFAGGPEEKVAPRTLLPGLSAEKVTRLEIWGPPKEGDGPAQESVALNRSGGKWSIATADDYPADSKKLDELVASLSALKVRSPVVSAATYHKKLEVAEGDYQRKLVITADGKAQTLFLGSSPAFKNVHLRLEGEDPVYLAAELSVGDVGTRAWSWVDRAYLSTPENGVWSVKVENAKGSLQLDKNPADSSWAALGVTEKLAKSTVDDLVRKASTINLETPVGKTEKPEYGLAAPLATVTLVTGTSTIAGAPPQKTETVTVKVGAKVDADNQYYLKSSTSEYVVKVAGWAVEPLISKAKEDLIEKPAAPPAP
jgi:hypothetical protein